MSYCNIFPKLLSSPIIKCLDVIYLQMMHMRAYSVINVVSNNLGVTTLEVGSHARSPSGQSDPWGSTAGGRMVGKEIVFQHRDSRPLTIDCPVDFEPHKRIRCCHRVVIALNTLKNCSFDFEPHKSLCQRQLPGSMCLARLQWLHLDLLDAVPIHAWMY